MGYPGHEPGSGMWGTDQGKDGLQTEFTPPERSPILIVQNTGSEVHDERVVDSPDAVSAQIGSAAFDLACCQHAGQQAGHDASSLKRAQQSIMETPLAILLAFVVRLGPPLLLTLTLTWILRALDRRWQAEASAQLIRGAGAVSAALEVLPCCDLMNCPPEKRAGCPAYADRSVPCWQHFRDGQGRLKQDCLICDVFRWAPVPKPAMTG